ncbi:MAG TPA: hypothetical protein VMW07_09710 [Gallionella sp.]|nr:hypothetical protein [Gallionella sp.]
MSAFDSSSLIAFAGIAIGFSLGEGSRYIRYRAEIWRSKRLVRTELKSVLAQLPQKRDILNQAISHMRQQRFLPMLSVNTVTVGYYSVQESLYPHLKPIERNCLHIIFERVRVADEQMDSMEEFFILAVKEKVQADPWGTFIGRYEDLLASYDVVAELAQSYLDGKPVDVFANKSG